MPTQTQPIEYVAGFVFNGNKSQVALIRKNRPTWMAGRLNAIGGHIEPGETPAEAVNREFEEETGLVPPPDSWKLFATLQGHDLEDQDFIVHFFYAMAPFNLDIKNITDEPVGWYTLEHTDDRMPNLRWLIPMALAADEGRDKAKGFVVHEQY